MRTRNPTGVALLILAASLLPGQDPKDLPLPALLKLKGDPAADLDLGGTHLVAPARRNDPKGPVVAAPYVCFACRDQKLQTVPQETAGIPDRVAGGSISAVRPWLAGLEADKPVFVATPRWTLACVLKESKVEGLRPEELMRLRAWFPAIEAKPTRLKPHELAHLWADRLIALEAALAELLDLSADYRLKPPPSGYKPLAFERSEIFVFSSKKDAQTFTDYVLEPRTRALAGCVMPFGPAGAIIAEEADDATRRRFHYGATFQLLRRHWRIGQGLPDWIQEGLAHYFERRQTNLPPGRDDEAGTLPHDQESPKNWEQFVRDLITDNKAGQLGALTATPERAFSLRSRIQSWSLVRYLIGVDPKRLAVFLNAILNTRPDTPASQGLLDAARAVYDADLPLLERGWKAWVLR